MLSCSTRTKISNYYFTLFFVGLLFASYVHLGEEFVVICGVIVFATKTKKFVSVKRFGAEWFVFLIYYFIVTSMGLLIGVLNVKDFLEFIIQYLLIIVILNGVLAKASSLKECMTVFKNFIALSAIYGLLESVMQHNYLPDVFSSYAVMSRINTMNILSYKYQSSSLFLHYTYFGVVLLFGIAINRIYPYKTSKSNVLFYLLCLIDLYFTKSRMCWLSLVVLIIYDMITNKIITKKMISRVLIAISSVIVTFILFNKQVVTLIETIYSRFAIISAYGMEYGSFGQRFGTLFNVPEYMINNPIAALFGSGYGSIKIAFLDKYSYFEGYGIADNQLTTFLIEVGIIGTSLVLIGISLFLLRNKTPKSLSRYLLIIMLFASITIDIIGTVYISMLAILPFCMFYVYERRKGI